MKRKHRFEALSLVAGATLKLEAVLESQREGKDRKIKIGGEMKVVKGNGA